MNLVSNDSLVLVMMDRIDETLTEMYDLQLTKSFYDGIHGDATPIFLIRAACCSTINLDAGNDRNVTNITLISIQSITKFISQRLFRNKRSCSLNCACEANETLR